MANAWIRADDFASGEVPAICARTGELADRLVRVRFHSRPGWTWILLLLGVIPFVLVSVFSSKELVGALPFTNAVVARYHRLTHRMWISGGIGIALILVGAVRRGALWLGLVGLVIAAALAIAREVTFVDARREGGWVVVRRAHRNFAQAVGDRYGRDVRSAGNDGR